LHARLRQPFSLPSGTAGINLRKVARYAWENCDPSQLRIGETDIAKEIELAFEDSEYTLGMPVHPGPRDLVDSLYANNTVTLLTARPPHTVAWTNKWLESNGFSFDGLVNVKEQKKSLFRSDVLIDDYIGTVREYLTETVGIAILVDQPWNRGEREDLQSWIVAGRLYIVEVVRGAGAVIDDIRRAKQK
jgi:hypothetical protein